MVLVFLLLAIISYLIIRHLTKRTKINNLLTIFYVVLLLGFITLLSVIIDNANRNPLLVTNNNVNDLSQVIIGACYMVDIGVITALISRIIKTKKKITPLQKILTIFGTIILVGITIYLMTLIILFLNDSRF